MRSTAVASLASLLATRCCIATSRPGFSIGVIASPGGEGVQSLLAFKGACGALAI